MLAPQRLVHTSPQRIMLPTLLPLAPLLLPRLSREVAPTLTLRPSTLRRMEVMRMGEERMWCMSFSSPDSSSWTMVYHVSLAPLNDYAIIL